jgi:hypothetical protein
MTEQPPTWIGQRMSDLQLAEELGASPRVIRALITRHRLQLERFGAVTPDQRIRGIRYALLEPQASIICRLFAGAELAVRRRVIGLFQAKRRADRQPPGRTTKELLAGLRAEHRAISRQARNDIRPQVNARYRTRRAALLSTSKPLTADELRALKLQAWNEAIAETRRLFEARRKELIMARRPPPAE